MWEVMAAGAGQCTHTQEAEEVGTGVQLIPFHSVWDPSLWDGATHIQGGGFLHHN